MKELKVHIQYVMLWEFKNNKNVTEIAKVISSVYGQGIITNCKAQNCFLKYSGDVIERWNLTRMFIRPQLRCFNKIDEM